MENNCKRFYIVKHNSLWQYIASMFFILWMLLLSGISLQYCAGPDISDIPDSTSMIDTIVVTDTTASFIMIDSVIADRIFWAGDSVKISWSSKCIPSIDIFFSYTNGSDWLVLADSLSASDSTFIVIIPYIQSEQCIIKIANHAEEKNLYLSTPFTSNRKEWMPLSIGNVWVYETKRIYSVMDQDGMYIRNDTTHLNDSGFEVWAFEQINYNTEHYQLSGNTMDIEISTGIVTLSFIWTKKAASFLLTPPYEICDTSDMQHRWRVLGRYWTKVIFGDTLSCLSCIAHDPCGPSSSQIDFSEKYGIRFFCNTFSDDDYISTQFTIKGCVIDGQVYGDTVRVIY